MIHYLSSRIVFSLSRNNSIIFRRDIQTFSSSFLQSWKAFKIIFDTLSNQFRVQNLKDSPQLLLGLPVKLLGDFFRSSPDRYGGTCSIRLFEFLDWSISARGLSLITYDPSLSTLLDRLCEVRGLRKLAQWNCGCLSTHIIFGATVKTPYFRAGR